MEDETLRGAFQDWEKLSASEEKQLAYEARVKEVMDAYSAKREAELYAKEQRKEGREEAQLSFAKKLIEREYDANSIIELTGLTRKQIEKLKGR